MLCLSLSSQDSTGKQQNPATLAIAASTKRRTLGGMASPVPATNEPALRRVVGVRGLAAAIFNITVGAAIFVLPAHVAASLGAAAPLAYLVCAVAAGLVALCIAEAGSRVPHSGGPYAYVERAFGPYTGYLCGVLLWLGITLAMSAVATVLANALGALVPALGGQLPRAALLIAVFASLAVVNIRGAALGSQVSGVATVAKILPLIAFVVLGLSHVRAENLALGSFPSLARLGESGLLLMFAFFGMESALQVSGEVRDGARAVPRAIALAVDGYLPRPLAVVHRAHHTPHVAIAIQGVIVCAIAITGTYVKLAIMANVAILLVYLACCLAIVRLRQLDAGAADKPFVMPGGGVVPWVAASLIVALLARATMEAVLLTGGVMAAASLAFLARPGRD